MHRALKISLDLIVNLDTVDTNAASLESLAERIKYGLDDITDGRKMFSAEMFEEGLTRLFANAYQAAVFDVQRKLYGREMVQVGPQSETSRAVIETEKLTADTHVRIGCNYQSVMLIDATECETYGHQYGYGEDDHLCMKCNKPKDGTER